jgi:hypothetical protein
MLFNERKIVRCFEDGIYQLEGGAFVFADEAGDFSDDYNCLATARVQLLDYCQGLHCGTDLIGS